MALPSFDQVKPSITRRVLLLGTAAFIGAAATIFGGSNAGAQQASSLPPDQCRNAIIISGAIKEKYSGKISRKLIDSFAQFRDSNCSLDTDFQRVKGTSDDEAFGEFRLNLIALRSKPAALTNSKN